MKILLAKHAGFCMGVRRAVEMALDAPSKHEEPICTYGPLIHNPQVLQLLEEKGISVIDDVPESASGTVLIRAHGVPPWTKNRLGNAGFKVIDATCPRVIKVQTIIHKHARQGYASIIIGDRDHPEVVGLLGYAGNNGYVVDSLKGMDDLPVFEKAIIVAQTTQNKLFFEEVKNRAKTRFPHYKIFDTICDSTEKRQAEVKRLAGAVDAMIVVGGRDSANTQRLAEIAAQSDKPTYHIESESELDAKALTSAHYIGITAGASTPNWIIKRVYRTLEALLSKKDQGWRRLVFAVQRILLLTNIYVALGAGCLCYTCSKLQGIEHYFPHVLISILYILSMHIFNNLIGIKSDRYNDPVRASFYNAHMLSLALLAIVAGGLGLLTAFTVGWIPFLILLAMSILGLSYNLSFFPKGLTSHRYRRIRDIPGSKTILIAMAWGTVTALLPSVSVFGKINLSTILVFIWSTCTVFVRTAFFDILDMQGDRIVGKETIPILVGEKQAMHLLKTMLLMIIFILFFSGIFHLISNLSFALVICPIFIIIVLLAHERGFMFPGIRLEFLIETHFILAGIITLIWSLV